MTSADQATPKGTAAFKERFHGNVSDGHFRMWNGYSLSSIGHGTYLGKTNDASDEKYEKAVAASLRSGCNLIDTAINYRNMRSERLIGRALEKLFADGEFGREEIFVSTRGGYIPNDGESPENIREYIHSHYIDTGLLGDDDLVGGCHAIAPAFLRDQIAKSLENLRLDSIDLYYLHNPEVHAAVLQEYDFYQRLKRAFTVLEDEVAQGRIARYGISSWDAFRADLSSPVYLSLEKIVEMAVEAGGDDHHFAAIQFPFNPAMMESFALNAQEHEGTPLSPIEAAARFGLMVTSSVPLLQGELLDQPPGFLSGMKKLETNACRLIQFTRSIPGITTVIVGMGNEKHVKENFTLAGVDPLSEEELTDLFG